MCSVQLFSLLKQLLHLCFFTFNRKEKDEWASPGVRRSDFRLQPGLLQLLSQWQSISGMKPGEQAAAVTSRGDRRGRQCDVRSVADQVNRSWYTFKKLQPSLDETDCTTAVRPCFTFLMSAFCYMGVWFLPAGWMNQFTHTQSSVTQFSKLFPGLPSRNLCILSVFFTSICVPPLSPSSVPHLI